jgi:hypothetical protein
MHIGRAFIAYLRDIEHQMISIGQMMDLSAIQNNMDAMIEAPLTHLFLKALWKKGVSIQSTFATPFEYLYECFKGWCTMFMPKKNLTGPKLFREQLREAGIEQKNERHTRSGAATAMTQNRYVIWWSDLDRELRRLMLIGDEDERPQSFIKCTSDLPTDNRWNEFFGTASILGLTQPEPHHS